MNPVASGAPWWVTSLPSVESSHICLHTYAASSLLQLDHVMRDQERGRRKGERKKDGGGIKHETLGVRSEDRTPESFYIRLHILTVIGAPSKRSVAHCRMIELQELFSLC